MIEIPPDQAALIEIAAAEITERRRGIANPARDWTPRKEQEGLAGECVFAWENGCGQEWRPRVYEDGRGDGGIDFVAETEGGHRITIDTKRSSPFYHEFWVLKSAQLADLVVFVDVDTHAWRGESFRWVMRHDVLRQPLREVWGVTSWIVPPVCTWPMFTLRISNVRQHIIPGRRLVDLNAIIARRRAAE